MQKLQSPYYFRTYNTNTFLLEDIEALCSLAQAHSFKPHFFDDEEHVFDSIEDIVEHKGRNINYLLMGFLGWDQGKGELISILFKRERGLVSANVSANGSSNILKALLTEIDTILNKRVRKRSILRLPYFWVGAFAGSLLPFILFEKGPNWFVPPAILLIPIILSLYTYATTSVLFLDRAHKKRSFFRRNADKILLLIIGTILGLLSKALYDHFIK